MNTKSKGRTGLAGPPGSGPVGPDGREKTAGQTRSDLEPGGFQELPLDLIDEDPHQPRSPDNPGFAPEAIEEIGMTIRARGVKSPISVRENPERPGRYLINHGARRYRGSKWAGKTTIPAFIDNDYNETDQVVENIQRNELTAREIADFIGRELAKGRRSTDIALSIGKSKSFVSQYSTLLKLPDPIAEVFNTGRTRNVTAINDLVKAYRKNPKYVRNWLGDPDQIVTRETVAELKEFIDDLSAVGGAGSGGKVEGFPEPEESEELTGWDDRPEAMNEDGSSHGTRPGRRGESLHLRRSIVRVSQSGRTARLILTRRPSSEGRGWLRYEDDGSEAEVDLKGVSLVAVTDS